jgi:hypothetical protein
MIFKPARDDKTDGNKQPLQRLFVFSFEWQVVLAALNKKSLQRQALDFAAFACLGNWTTAKHQ